MSKNKIIRDILFIDQAYYLNDKTITQTSLDGYELLMNTNDMGTDISNSYQALILINYAEKSIILANAGSRYAPVQSMLVDLFDSMRFALGCKPYNVDEIIKVNEMLLDSLGSEVENYKFHYTGHSLGGLIAQSGAVHMKMMLAKLGFLKQSNQVTSVTFENPGAKSLIHDICKDYDYSLTTQEFNNFITFNNRKNFINNLKDSYGKIYNINPEYPNSPEKANQSSIFKTLRELSPESLFGKFFHLCEMGIAKLQEEHALENFKNFFEQPIDQQQLDCIGNIDSDYI